MMTQTNIRNLISEIADVNEVADIIAQMHMSIDENSALGRIIYHYQDNKIKTVTDIIAKEKNLSTKERNELFDMVLNVDNNNIDTILNKVA